MKRTRIVIVLGLLTGCAGLIGVPDLTLDDSPADAGPIDSGSLVDGTSTTVPPRDSAPQPVADTGTPGADAQPDATAGDSATCDLGKVQTDPLNCGACGTSCLGADCAAGKCQALALATVANAPLNNIVEHGPSLYVSTYTFDVRQQGGIFVVPKAGGAAVPYVAKFNAETMAIVGTTLYFVVDEARFDDAGAEGGLWKCDLNGPIPCVPVLVSPADGSRGLSTDKGYVYFSDANQVDASDYGIKRLAPEAGAKPELWRFDFAPSQIWLSDEGFYFVVSVQPSDGDRVKLFDVYPDAGTYTNISEYKKKNASAGQITGSANALYYTAYDFQTTIGGVVRRVSRPNSAGTTPCDYGGAKNLRPRGLHIADSRIYWTNLGETTSIVPNGSINYCALDGCCADPTVVWTGGGEPSALTSDDKALYWVGRESGTIHKMLKP